MVEQNRESQTPVLDRKPSGQHPGDDSTARFDKHLPQLLKRRLGFSRKGSGKHGGAFLFFGVILPLIAIGFELTTHFCAQHFFDPFPSANHVILFMLIPLSNYMAWLSGRRDMSPHYGFMALISGMAMGIGCLYALMFLPLTPHSAFYSLFFGFGLLGFAPLLSVPCTWLSGKTVCKLASNRKTFFDPHQVEHIGHLIVLCLVVAVELPSTLTRMNLSLAADPNTEKQGVQWLRQFGSEEVMLRACYERSGRATDILGSLYESGHPLSIESARSIFYKVTGKPFNSVPIPSAARATIQHAGLIDDPNGFNAGVKDEFDLDSDIAGENVSGVSRGLTVSRAEVHGTVEPNSAVADLDWTATFSNSSPYDREARAKLLLPADGVVTKATVTVNGVERDATILVRSLARTIYKQSVIDHKDPLLVSTCGVNQVLIQCFPVQPNSDMKVHLQIAAPLVLSPDKKTGSLMLPAFEERNFQFETPVNVTFTSTGRILAPVSKVVESGAATKAGSSTFTLDPAQIARLGGVVNFARDSEISKVISNPKSSASGIEARAIVPTYKMPEKMVVLIDGSAPMQRYIPELAAALKGFPAAVKVEIIVVGDDVVSLGTNSNPSACATALSALDKFRAVGGHADDNQLLNRIATTPVLWIHGAQPMNSGNSKLLTDLLNRPSDTPWLYDLQTVSGPNELLSGLEPNSNFVSVARVGKLQDDLSRLFSSWKTGTVKPSDNLRFADWNRPTDVAVENQANISGDSKHELKLSGSPISGLSQLYGYQKLLESYKSSDITPALVLAEKYHLVSPVSSAVVMEVVPSLHPSPMSEGEKKSIELPLKMPQFAEFAKNEMSAKKSDAGLFDPFASVATRLNNLSAAAGTSDGFTSSDKKFQSAISPHAQEENLKIARDEAQPTDDSLSGAPVGGASVRAAGGGGGGAKDFILSTAGSNQSYPMQKMKENVQYRAARKSGNDESFEAPPPQAAPPPPATPVNPDVPMVDPTTNQPVVNPYAASKALAPSLQGATNGTVGPAAGIRVDNDKEFAAKQEERKPSSEPMYSRAAPMEAVPASSAPSSAPTLLESPSPKPSLPWIGSFGVQPQMEMNQEKRRDSEQGWSRIEPEAGKYSDTYAGMKPAWDIGTIFANIGQIMSRSGDGFVNAHPMLWSALSIFVLIFMWVYAFFKLVRAMSRK